MLHAASHDSWEAVDVAKRKKAPDIVKRGQVGDGEVELRISNRREVDGGTQFDYSLALVKPITLAAVIVTMCETCEGKGWVIDDDLPGVRLICRVCEGERSIVSPDSNHPINQAHRKAL